MRGDEQADICRSEDGEGILVYPVHRLTNLKALSLSYRCHSALDLGLARGSSPYLRRLHCPHTTANHVEVQQRS